MSAEDGKGWGSLRNAARMRDWVREIVMEVLSEEWPGAKFGTVTAIDRSTSECMVLYQGDDSPVAVRMYALQPSAVGQAVIIDGPRRRRSIVQVLGQTFIPGVPTAGWLQTTDAPVGRFGGFSAEIGQRIYFGGGVDSTLVEDSFVSYEVDLASWAIETPLPAGAVGAGADKIGLNIFVVGGTTAGSDEIWKYDTESNAWDTGLTSMPGPKTLAAVAAWSDQIYVFGGLSSSLPSEVTDLATYCYDPGSDSWTTVAPLPAALNVATARAIGDYIYVFGSDSTASENRLYRYNPVADTFTLLAAFPELIAYFSTTVFGEKLAVLGGMDMLTFTASTKAWLYDPTSDTWSEIQPLPAQVFGGSAGHSSTKLVFHGGVPDFSGAAVPTTFVYTPA